MGNKKDKDKKQKKKSRNKIQKKKDSRRDSDYSSDQSVDKYELQIQQGQTAVKATRRLLTHYPNSKKDLREILNRLDEGEAVNVSGLKDADMKSMLEELLAALCNRKSKGFSLRKGHQGAMSLLAPILAQNFPPPKSRLPSQPTEPPQSSSPPQPSAQQATHPSQPRGVGIGPDQKMAGQPTADPSSSQVLPPATSPCRDHGMEHTQEAQRMAAGYQVGRSRQGDEDRQLGLDSQAGVGRQAGAMGRSLPGVSLDGTQAAYCGRYQEVATPEEGQAEDATQQAQGRGRGGGNVQSEQGDLAVGGGGVIGPDMGPLSNGGGQAGDEPQQEKRRVLGPMRPPEGVPAPAAEEVDLDDMIGPMPSELQAELASAPDDKRLAEAVRVLRVIEEGAPDGAVDAYQLLGVERAAEEREVKKKYQRLSLLIHPDKCKHKLAHKAFQAVSDAAKTLLNPQSRQALNEQLDDAKLKQAMREDERQERQRQEWAVLRKGGSLKAMAPAGGQGRDSWMTSLPEKRAPATMQQMMEQKSQTAFSQSNYNKEQDPTWAQVPGQGPAGGGAAGPARVEQSTQLYALPEAPREGKRPLTLLEKHQENLDKEKKKKKKKQDKQQTAKEPQRQEDWVGKHPWRPFDREKDLELPTSTNNAGALLKNMKGLQSKFSSAGGQSSFI